MKLDICGRDGSEVGDLLSIVLCVKIYLLICAVGGESQMLKIEVH
jgi:hypothetical protein